MILAPKEETLPPTPRYSIFLSKCIHARHKANILGTFFNSPVLDMESWHLTTLTDCIYPKFSTTLSSLHCMALSLGIMVGLAGGLEQLLIKLFLLSIVGEACTVNLC